jgi:small subunit ribosomal protein S18
MSADRDRGDRGERGERGAKGGFGRTPRQKVCVFCKERIAYIDYKDSATLRRFMSDRGKIRARRVSGNCSRHQEDVAMAIKNAREMALLPYTIR